MALQAKTIAIQREKRERCPHIARVRPQSRDCPGIAKLSVIQSDRVCERDARGQPEFCLALRMRHRDVHPRLLPRKEEQARLRAGRWEPCRDCTGVPDGDEMSAARGHVWHQRDMGCCRNAPGLRAGTSCFSAPSIELEALQPEQTLSGPWAPPTGTVASIAVDTPRTVGAAHGRESGECKEAPRPKRSSCGLRSRLAAAPQYVSRCNRPSRPQASASDSHGSPASFAMSRSAASTPSSMLFSPQT
jgi:hypothetical protein